jgi:hypothetical protein
MVPGFGLGSIWFLLMPPFVGVIFPGSIFKARAHDWLNEDHRLFVWMALEDGFNDGCNQLIVLREGKFISSLGSWNKSVLPGFDPSSGLNCKVPVLDRKATCSQLPYLRGVIIVIATRTRATVSGGDLYTDQVFRCDRCSFCLEMSKVQLFAPFFYELDLGSDV